MEQWKVTPYKRITPRYIFFGKMDPTGQESDIGNGGMRKEETGDDEGQHDSDYDERELEIPGHGDTW